jgi:hypothetical protein
MKKDVIRSLIVEAVLLAIFHLITFVVPFAHTEAFWFSYAFGLVALVLCWCVIYMSLIRKANVKSKFYGFPIARIAVIHCMTQLVASLLVMAIGPWIPGWIPMLVYAIGLGVAVIGLIGAEAVSDEIQVQDTKLKKDVSVMRSAQSKVRQLATQCDEPLLKKLAEEIRYADPVSHESLKDAEADLFAALDQLQQAVADEDMQSVATLSRQALALLEERNRLCKLSKA